MFKVLGLLGSLWITLCVVAYIFLNWVRRQLRINDVSSKYVLVTGCDTGIGTVLVQKLDMMGVHVFASCLGESAQWKLRQVTSNRTITLPLDITRDDSVQQAVEFVRSNLPAGQGITISLYL